MSASSTPADIVARAIERSGLTQAEFAAQYGTRQSLLSKYKNGKVDPPPALLMQCMNICGMTVEPDISAEDLAASIRKNLHGPAHAQLRRAILDIVRSVACA